jgi:Domain of unknown function (DUF222)/HNH endonuclease
VSPTDTAYGAPAPGAPAPGAPAPGAAAAGAAAGPANAAEALAAVRAGLEYLAAADPTELTTDEQADCIRGLAAAESVHLSAASRLLAAFDAANGYAAYGQISARAWLRWQTRVTSPAAAATTAWMRRLAGHPAVAAGLTAAALSPSWARAICDWTDQLPDADRADADQILAETAAGCAQLSDVRLAFERIRALCAQPDTGDGDDRFAQRRLRLDPHFQGHGRLDADLTPAATAALQAVLDSLGKRAGPEDIRTRAQRDHDALEEACRRLIASAGLPDRAGQPVQIQLHMSLSQLTGGPEADPETAAWIAAHGTPAPPGADCDATIVPVVTGTLNEDLLDQLAAGLVSGRGLAAAPPPASRRLADIRAGLDTGADPPPPAGLVIGPSSTDAETILELAERAARHVTIAHAVKLLSGPDGLAAWLRTRQESGLAGSVSLPLDIGTATETIPAHLRRAVVRRDRHCRFPGCEHPPAACHVHHLIPRSKGGPTSLANCTLLCAFHHLIAIHRWGWTLTLNPDGTTIAISPDGQRTLHSHAPPTAA